MLFTEQGANTNTSPGERPKPASLESRPTLFRREGNRTCPTAPGDQTLKRIRDSTFPLCQMQMLQGLSGLSQAQGGLTNPLLYYTYYTQVSLHASTVSSQSKPPLSLQMVAAMQAQQQKLLETPGVQGVNNNHLPMQVKDLLSPLRQGAVHRVKQDQVGEKQILTTFHTIIPCESLYQVRNTRLQKAKRLPD